MQDRFGESGKPSELLDYFGLSPEKISETVKEFIENTSQYHREY
jgi:transketolase C-terminal domain/subunit